MNPGRVSNRMDNTLQDTWRNSALWVKKGGKGGGNTGSFPRPAPVRCIPLVRAHCVPVPRVSAPAAAELLHLSPSAGTKPKKLKATLLLQSWWPAGRFKWLKSACRAALLDLLGCFSLAGPPFVQDSTAQICKLISFWRGKPFQWYIGLGRGKEEILGKTLIINNTIWFFFSVHIYKWFQHAISSDTFQFMVLHTLYSSCRIHSLDIHHISLANIFRWFYCDYTISCYTCVLQNNQTI